jgi:hypothetical protein
LCALAFFFLSFFRPACLPIYLSVLLVHYLTLSACSALFGSKNLEAERTPFEPFGASSTHRHPPSPSSFSLSPRQACLTLLHPQRDNPIPISWSHTALLNPVVQLQPAMALATTIQLVINKV